MSRKLIIIIAVLFGLCTMTNLISEEKLPEKVFVTMKTSMGDIELELFPELAPKTVENFEKYVRDGFYDGLIFHRIIDGFMIQGGGFEQSHKFKEATYEPIENEADNGLSNITGTIAMARTNLPHSATSQFFININDNLFLDHKDKGRGWGYCVFGRVTTGMDIVNQIKSVPTHFHPQLGMKDWPVENVVIESVIIK